MHDFYIIASIRKSIFYISFIFFAYAKFEFSINIDVYMLNNSKVDVPWLLNYCFDNITRGGYECFPKVKEHIFLSLMTSGT